MLFIITLGFLVCASGNETQSPRQRPRKRGEGCLLYVGSFDGHLLGIHCSSFVAGVNQIQVEVRRYLPTSLYTDRFRHKAGCESEIYLQKGLISGYDIVSSNDYTDHCSHSSRRQHCSGCDNATPFAQPYHADNCIDHLPVSDVGGHFDCQGYCVAVVRALIATIQILLSAARKASFPVLFALGNMWSLIQGTLFVENRMLCRTQTRPFDLVKSRKVPIAQKSA